MTTPSISIVVPVYNSSRYLAQSLESVVTQSAPADEILIGYDKSNDDTLAIAERFAGRDRRVRVVHNERPAGIFSNLNNIVAASRGDLVHIFCDDDIMKPECLAEMLAHVGNRVGQFCIAFCRFDRIDETGRVDPDFNDQLAPYPSGLYGRDIANEFFALEGCAPGNLSTVMADGKLLRASGGFNESKPMAADFDMWVRLAQARPFALINRPLVQCRHHDRRASIVLNRGRAYIAEDQSILQTLIDRSTDPDRIRELIGSERGVQYCSWLAQGALKGDFDGLADHLRVMHQTFGLGRLAWYCLRTWNRRIDAYGLQTARREFRERVVASRSFIPFAPDLS